MKLWVIEYMLRGRWRPMNFNYRTKREATYKLKDRRVLEPHEDFRLARYIRE